jgi:hypothetical protein
MEFIDTGTEEYRQGKKSWCRNLKLDRDNEIWEVS